MKDVWQEQWEISAERQRRISGVRTIQEHRQIDQCRLESKGTKLSARFGSPLPEYRAKRG